KLTHLARDEAHLVQDVRGRPVQVHGRDVQSLAVVDDGVFDLLGFTGGVDQEPGWQVESGDVGEELVQVGVVHARYVQALVLRVANEPAEATLPQRQVR